MERIFFATTHRNALVQTQFDTGAMGLRTLYGRVIAKGPRRCTIKWESGVVNRVEWGRNDISPARDAEYARQAMAKVEQ